MKGRKTLESIADQTSEMWENGCTSPQISDLIAKEVGNIVCESPMRGWVGDVPPAETVEAAERRSIDFE